MAQSAIKVLPSTSDYYYWHVSGRPLSVILSLQLVSRLEEEIRRAQADAGTSLTGVLLGKAVSTQSIIIENYEAAPTAEKGTAEDAPGNRGLENLIERSLKGPQKDLTPVGFFRTQTAGWLELNDDDLIVARRFFAAPNNIVLLIRPSQSRGSTGAIFTWDAPGQISGKSSYCEFPFDASLLKNLQTNRSDGSESSNESEEAPLQDSPGPSRAEKLLANRKLLGALALLGLVCICVLIASFVGRQRAPAWQSGVSIIETPQNGGIGLAVKRQQGDLNISWDRSSKLFVNGTTGMLVITDGTLTKTKRLDDNQLREGQVLYSPGTGDVDVRLIVTRADNKSWAESVQTMSSQSQGDAQRVAARSFLPADLPAQAGPPPAAPARVQAELPHQADLPLQADLRLPADLHVDSRLPPANATTKAQVNDAPKELAPTRTTARKEGPKEFVPPSSKPQQTVAQAQIPILPPPDLRPGSTTPVPLPPNASATEPNAPAATRQQQLSSATPNAQAERAGVPKVISNDAEATALHWSNPPKPTQRVTPALGVRQIAAVLSPTGRDVMTVDVNVSIDAKGKVTKADAEIQKNVPTALISAAVEAARQWRFEPAKLNGKNVPGEIVLRFVFRR